tara:strand:+ start:141 stop:302 length:162 start_codon:yes stop_codon:yes gene_type:complete
VFKLLDNFFYKFCGLVDDAVAKVETYAIKLVEWCWHSRVNLLQKKRRNKKYKH